MRLIDADELETRIKKLKSQIASRAAGFVDEDSYECGAVDALYDALTYLHEVETVDAVPVVRCKDCKQWDEEGSYMGRGWCGYQMKSTGPRYFCADGEVEEGEEDDETGDH